MAHTADRRSEKALSQTRDAIKARRKYRAAQANGKCVVDGCTNEVIGRSYCYEHSSKQVRATYLSGARAFARLAGFDLSGTSVTLAQAAAFLELIKYK